MWAKTPRRPCLKDYKQGDNRFTGKVVKVVIAVQPSGLSAERSKGGP